MNQIQKPKVVCLACGYLTLDQRGDWEICEICFWEDDVIADRCDVFSQANRMMLSTAQENFARIGAIDERSVEFVRSPTVNDVRDKNWKPITKP